MLKVLLAAVAAMLLCAGPVSAVPVFGEPTGINPFETYAPFEADNEPVKVKIDPALTGSTVQVGVPFSFDIAFANYTYQPDLATSLPVDYANNRREANAGHFHAYGALLDGNNWNQTNVFLGATAFTLIEDGLLEATMTLPAAGSWLIYAEAQYDDHTSRIRPHPQQIGAWDAAWVNAVVPEPGAAILFMVATFMVLGLRNRKHLYG